MMRLLRFGLIATVFALVVLPRVSLGDVDFIRGDVNGDGQVTISDGFRILMWYRDGYDPPQCMDAADVNDNGVIGTEDIVYLLQTLYSGARSIPPPFPEPGQDLTDDLDPDLDCKAYGGGEVLEDPAYQLKILDATAPGGDESAAWIEFVLTNSVPIAAVSGQIRLLSPIIRAEGMTTPIGWNFVEVLSGEDWLWFGVMAMTSEDSVPPGEEVQVRLRIILCLKEGTPAGEYPVVLETVELTDGETGQAIVPQLTGGTLVVEEAVTGGVDDSVWSSCRGPPGDPRPRPETVNAVFSLSSESAARGGSATVSFTIRADAPADGYSFSMDFDEDVLQVQSAEFAWENPDGSEYDFSSLEFNNRNDDPGNAGVDEGFIAGAAVFDFDGQSTMPADIDNLALRIHFQVKPEASIGTTTIRFLNGGQSASGQPTNNVLTTYGFSVTPGSANSFVFVEGRISVMPDIATFRRGDSNDDDKVDLSDAVRTLNFLFLGTPPLVCLDAADFNDDGQIDVSDPIATLGFLFLDGNVPPPPFPEDGLDPTEDSMVCPRRE